MRLKPVREKTRLVWSWDDGALVCEKCGALVHMDLGFERCPYCRRMVEKGERYESGGKAEGFAGGTAGRG